MHPHVPPSVERDAPDEPERPTLGISSCLPLLEALPDAMFLVDDHGRITHANRAAVDLFLLDLESVYGQPMGSLLSDDVRDRYALLRADSLGVPQTLDPSGNQNLMATRRDGTQFHAEIVLSPMWLKEGHYTLADIRDVSQRKRIEMAAHRHAEEMEDFAAAVTHDLKAPLTGIEWLSKEVLALVHGLPCEAGSHDEAERLLGKIGQSATQMRALIDGLLEVARFGTDAHRGGALASPQGVAEEVQAALEPRLAQRGIAMGLGRIDIETLPIAPAHLRQVLHNLVGNALKHVPATTGRVQISAVERIGQNGERVAHVISDDNGPGVAPHDRQRIFRVFQRGPQERDPGVGLGLSLVGKVASFYGGSAWVEDSPLGGARFIVELPLDHAIGSARAALNKLTDAIHNKQRQSNPVAT